jgi:predicted PurR-regulated permease PerM
MSSIFRSRFIRRVVVFMFAGGALLVGYYGLSLLVEAFDRHGSPGGNAILFALGLILLVLSPLAVIAGVVYWTSSSPNPGDKNT